MFYHEVLVGDLRYHGNSALTYAHDSALLPGSVVRIALRDRSVLGIVLRQVAEPSFVAKPISAAAPAPPLPAQSLALLEWLYEYYPASFGSIVRQFLPPTTVFPKQAAEVTPAPHRKHKKPTSAALPPLTKDQLGALDQIGDSGYHLLRGVTGSGKTRLYLELAKRMLESNKSVIVLTPEIGLTAQLTVSFEQAFPGKVHVLHSRLTDAARRDAWYNVLRCSGPQIVIGPRSALFTPMQKLGLIVIDESHDQAYKSETAPYYRTERVAAKLAALHGACLVSGSATPNIEEYYVAAAKGRPIVTLPHVAIPTSTALTVQTVDMRDRAAFAQSAVLASPLIEAMRTSLAAHEQSLLFLNRRGTASAILCASCGWRALCGHCDLAMTYHGDTHTMRCHVCGKTQPLPVHCPECQAADILLKTIGTKAVVDEVKRLFPGARISRFDTDTAKTEQLETQLETLQRGSVDIIIGTQMITKGLDLPGLSTVGVLNADSSLLIPDYTASERTFQLITQVLGRVGRGHRSGVVVLQSYAPDSPLIAAAISKNWQQFYDRELAERKMYRFPPFTYLLKLSCLRAKSGAAEQAAESLKQTVRRAQPNVRVEGPAPCFHPRERGKYKWQLIVKSSRRSVLQDIIHSLPSGWQYDIDPTHLL